MYFKCISCEKFGESCRGRNFLLMPGYELAQWIIAYKEHHSLTTQRLSLKTGTPAGTLGRILSGSGRDFKYDTAQQIMRGIAGEPNESDLCPDPSNLEIDRLQSRIRHLEQELDETRRMAEREHAHLIAQVKNLRKALSIMTAALIFVLFAIICVLLYDINHLDVGYFRG